MSEKKGNDTIVMEEKNRFSRLLEQLLGEAEIKSNTLAQELQYDVSYISKWINGRMLPSEKTEKRVLASIAHCIVSSASEDGLLCLQENYNIKEVDVLEGAVRDHLTAEYNYTREQQKEGDSSGTQKTRFFPELSIQQYLKQMKHPVLRRVKSLHIIMMTDLMAMDYESRIKFMSLDEQNIDKQRPFPEVHVSLILNLEDSRGNCLCDVLFLLNLLSDSIHIGLRLYSSRRAYGRLIFAIRKEFVSAGMLEESGRCLSVTVSEDEGYCRQIYEAVQGYAN